MYFRKWLKKNSDDIVAFILIFLGMSFLGLPILSMLDKLHVYPSYVLGVLFGIIITYIIGR